MVPSSIPIQPLASLTLSPTAQEGVSSVSVLDPAGRKELSWDRYVRLAAAADEIERLVPAGTRVLDAGGYDGALALFLPDYEFDLIDPATTGASVLAAPVADGSYEIAVSVDVLEHIDPHERAAALTELARVARRAVVLNYPCRHTKEAQELMLALTGNHLIREHVEWELPDTGWVMETMSELGFTVTHKAHASLAVWLGQYLTLNLAPEAAVRLNRYLVDNHAAEPFSTPLYHLVVCRR